MSRQEPLVGLFRVFQAKIKINEDFTNLEDKRIFTSDQCVASYVTEPNF